MIHPTHHEEKRIYLFIQGSFAVVCLFVALIPIPASLMSWIQSQLYNWQNIQYLRLALMFAGFGIAVQACVNQLQKQDKLISPALHVLITVLIIYASIATVLFLKYLFGVIPELGVGQAIFLYTVLSDSVTDLFAKENMFQPPFLMPMYGPFYFGVARFLFNIFGESFFILRFLTVFSLVAISGVLKVIAQRYSNSACAWIAPAMFLAIFPLVVWSGAPTKPEYFAAFFSMSGIFVYYYFGFNDNKGWVIASGLLFLLALLIKFFIVVGLLATLTHLLLRRKYHEFFGLFIFSFGLFGVIYYWLNMRTDGGLLLFNVMGNAPTPQLLRIISAGLLKYLNDTFNIIASTAILLLLLQEKTLKNITGLIGVAFFMSLALGVVSIGRPGSTSNYFLEGVVFGSLAIGLLIASAPASPIVNGILWIVIFYLAFMFPTRAALIAQSYGDPDEEEKIVAQIRSLDVKEDEYILSDLEYNYQVYRAGKNLLLLDSFYFTLLTENGLIDSSILFNYLKDERVPYLVLHIPLDENASLPYGNRYFPEDITEYLIQNYRCETRMKRWDGAAFVLCSRLPSVP
jgi:hypothetical protein